MLKIQTTQRTLLSNNGATQACYALSWDTDDGAVDLVKMTPRGPREEAESPPLSIVRLQLPTSYLLSFAFTGLRTLTSVPAALRGLTRLPTLCT